ncbi:MAG: hypothetical protein IJS28_07370 [Synergistaceae bacterium]|nr:hypothetical protein [Synergistaceae bacterium]
MTPAQMVAMVRRFISDEQATGFSTGGNMEQPEGTQELLTYLDRAVDDYSKRQAALGDVRLLKTITGSSGTMLPPDFLMLCGTVPVSVEGRVLRYYDDEGTMPYMPVRYFARLPYVTDYGDTQNIPYQRDQEMSICALAAIYALNKHEFNVSQDLMLLGYGAVNNANAEQ